MSWGQDTDADEAGAALLAFLDAGGTLVDTADVYGGGEAERILGGLFADVIPRAEVVVATQAGARREDGPFGGGASRSSLLAALDTSLERMGTDYVDVWQLHGWDDDVPLDESLAAVDVAVSTGRARYAGVANYDGWQVASAARRQAIATGALPLVSAQTEYSLLDRRAEASVIPAATYHGLGLLPWAPLGRGVLTGKYREGTPADSRAASAHLADYVDRHRTERTARIVQAVVTAAHGLGTSPLAVALAWVRDRPGVVAPVVGARDGAQLLGSLAAEDLTLPPAIRGALDDVSVPPVADDPDAGPDDVTPWA